MEIVSTDSSKATIEFTKDEFRVLGNTLNEVRNAFSWDFSYTGWTKDEAQKLHDYIIANYRLITDNKIVCNFTKYELLFLIEAINETLRELDRLYSTRLGYTLAEAHQLQSQLQDASQLLQ